MPKRRATENDGGNGAKITTTKKDGQASDVHLELEMDALFSRKSQKMD